MYANLTKVQKDSIIDVFRNAKRIAGYNDPCHFAAIAARNVLVKSNRGWSGKTGSNAFAAAIATLIMANEIRLF